MQDTNVAFSLIQLSGIVLAAGLVAAAVIPEGGGPSRAERTLLTHDRMQKIESATRKHMMAREGRRPCPASGDYYPGHANFGREDGSPGDCADSGSIDGVLTPFDDTNVVAGTVPTTSLHLSPDYYFDGWGRPFTYVVDKRATDPLECVQITGTGDVKIFDGDGGTRKSSNMYAIISHGPDGHGSYQPGGSSKTNRLDAGSTDQDQHNNAGTSASTIDPPNFNPATFNNEWVKKEQTSTYDDFLWYSEGSKNTCCEGKECGESIAILNPPVSLCPPDVLRLTGSQNNNYIEKVVTGDINGDGIEDVYIAGWAGNLDYVLFGRSSAWPLNASNDLYTTLNGTNGFTVTGTGKDVDLGDVNGDGYDDIVLLGSTSELQVVFGGPGPRTGVGTWESSWPATFGLNTINGDNGFSITRDGTETGSFLKVVVGNVDGDGYEDILLSQRFGTAVRGHVHLFLGRATWPTTQSNLAYMDGTQGFRFDGWRNNDGAGYDVDYPTINFGYAIGLVDLDNDSKDDMVIASQGHEADPQNYQMQMVVLYGSSTPATQWSATNEIESVAASERWWTYYPAYGGIPFGFSRGDLNDDGNEDLVLSLDSYSRTAVFYGAESAARITGEHVDLRTYLNGTNGFSKFGLVGATPFVADANNDGRDDLAVAVRSTSPFAALHLQPGGGFTSSSGGLTDADVHLDWSGSVGEFGYGITVADLNDDSYKDVIVTGQVSDLNGYTNNGAAYVVWGNENGFPAEFDLVNIPVTTCSE